MSDDTRDRTIRLEADLEHLAAKVDAMAIQVREMHELLMQARGARWTILGLAIIGGVLVHEGVRTSPMATCRT